MSYETTHTLINIQYTLPYTHIHTHTLLPMKTLRVRISKKTILSMLLLIVIADISDNDSGSDNTDRDTHKTTRSWFHTKRLFLHC